MLWAGPIHPVFIIDQMLPITEGRWTAPSGGQRGQESMLLGRPSIQDLRTKGEGGWVGGWGFLAWRTPCAQGEEGGQNQCIYMYTQGDDLVYSH